VKRFNYPAGEGMPNPNTTDTYGDGTVIVVVPETDAEHEQLNVLLEAMDIYSERNERYKDNWQRMGWRGPLIRLRERTERLWDYLWDYKTSRHPAGQPAVDAPDLDDAFDLINFAAFLIRGVRTGVSRGGEWWRDDQ
jgi:hypothetical protein